MEIPPCQSLSSVRCGAAATSAVMTEVCGRSWATSSTKSSSGGRAAGLRPCTPHDLRRSAITHLLERGTDALAVQAFARHGQLSTTTRYDRCREEAKRETARKLVEPKRVPPAPISPRPRRIPSKGKKGRGGRPRLAPLVTRPRAALVALARAHGIDVGEQATRAELARSIRESVEEGERGIEG